jgi:hypothetical protein
VLAIVTGAAIVVTTGTASAYWGASGTGHGSARTGTMPSLNADPGTPTTLLVPGGRADVTTVISNPTDAPMLVTSVTTPAVGAAGFSDSGLLNVQTGCDSAHSGVTPVVTTPQPASFVIAPHGSYTLTMANAVTMASTSPNACQGAFFGVGITLQAHSAVGSAATVPAEGTL